jgi:hypothetical protein
MVESYLETISAIEQQAKKQLEDLKAFMMGTG